MGRKYYELLGVDTERVKAELPQLREHLEQFGDRLPQELRAHLDKLEQDL